MTSARVLIVAAVLVALVASTAAAADQARAESRPSVSAAMKQLSLIRPPSPTPAPDFMARLTDGPDFHLAAQRGKVVFINFWATWCLPCRAEMPLMESLWRRHRTQSFALLAVSTDSTPSTVPPFLAQQGFTFAVTVDQDQVLARAYGLRGLPMTVIIDAAGNVAGIAIGPRDWNSAVANALIEGLMP